MDLCKVSPEVLVRELLRRCRIDDDDPHLQDTPQRVVRMFSELLAGYSEPEFKLTTFPVKGTPSLVTVTNVEFYSLCAHHMLPFFGAVHISYLPEGKLCGLSKLARVVRHFSARLQIQEEMTEQIAEFLQEKLEPAALAVMVIAEHTCMSMRGVRSPHHRTTTSAMRGKFIDDWGLKSEFFRVLELTK